MQNLWMKKKKSFLYLKKKATFQFEFILFYKIVKQQLSDGIFKSSISTIFNFPLLISYNIQSFLHDNDDGGHHIDRNVKNLLNYIRVSVVQKYPNTSESNDV